MSTQRTITPQISADSLELYTRLLSNTFSAPEFDLTLYSNRGISQVEHALNVLQTHVRSCKRQTQIPFTINRTQVTALFVILKDMGLISARVTDTELAHLLEEHFVYDYNKPLSSLKIEIHKLRSQEKNNEALEEYFKSLFSTCHIGTNDD